MLYLVQSNKMECLAESLISCLQETAGGGSLGKGSSVFEPDQILVQSPGMSQWLKIQIAEELGIAANIDFPLPSSFIWQLYQQHIQDLPDQSAFTKANMTWKLMSILPTLLDEPEFGAIQEYLTDAPALKLYQLAGKIADVYDQYLVYRPDWILHWEAGHNDLPDSHDPTICQSHPWQSVLWRALISNSLSLGESPFHRANLHETLLDKLRTQANQNNHSEQPNKGDAKPLMVFGISAMPMQQLQVLSALAETRDVLIFWFNPSQQYWGDIVDKKTQARAQLKELASVQLTGAELLDVGNPLLASWGKLGRDYQDMLLGLELQQQDCFIDNEPEFLLEHIQCDVNNLQFRGTPVELDANELLSNGMEHPKIEINQADNSLQVHACHSKVRELEVLHDQLLARFNNESDWHPGDVIVMMPDVAAYAPFIEGVFGAVDSSLAIPYAISDRNVGQVSPLLASFLQLMKLHQSRLTLSEVLSLVEVPAIQRKFAIDSQEFELLQHWLTDAGVRWGWDEQDKLRWDLPTEKQNTWVFGLQRLLAGYAMSSDQLYQGSHEFVSAYADIEGQQAVALGKCYQFTAVLLKVLAFCQQSQSLQVKIEQALNVLSELYEADDIEQTDMQVLRETLENMFAHSEQYTDNIDQDVFVSQLQQNIQEKGVGQRFLAGYVNFCTLMPMRSIPFKMVCLLGMNDTDYPRQSVPMGFDLMRLAPIKRGDRSRRLDDRYLFLEALLSAREQLYFSYQGFSQKDNSPLAPSILLSELLEYCQQGFCLSGQLALDASQTEKNLLSHLTIKHKLQPFDQAYFTDKQLVNAQTTHFSFNHKQQAIAEQVQQPCVDLMFNVQPLISAGEQSDKSETVDLNELVAFFQNPAKAFFIQRWQTRFYPLGQLHSDEEPFAFDGLDRYQVNERLVQHTLKHTLNVSSPEDEVATETGLLNELRAEGKLPAGKTGELALRPLSKQSEHIAQQILQLSQMINTSDSVDSVNSLESLDSMHSVDISLMINDILVAGRVDNLYGANLILWRTGKLRAKDRIALYLAWLCLCANGVNSVSGVNSVKERLGKAHFISTEKPYSLPVVEKQDAIDLLGNWLAHWQSGHAQLLHFYPEAAWQWVNTQDINKTINSFIGNDFAKGEGTEAHIQRVCPDLAVHFEQFSQVADELLLPLVELGDSK